MNKLKSLTLSVIISIFLLGVLNLFVLKINKKVAHIPEIKTETLLTYDIGVQNIFGLLVQPMKQVETFYLYNYFDGVFQDYSFKNNSEESTRLSMYKKVLLPISALVTFMLMLGMLINSVRFGQLTFPRKET